MSKNENDEGNCLLSLQAPYVSENKSTKKTTQKNHSQKSFFRRDTNVGVFKFTRPMLHFQRISKIFFLGTFSEHKVPNHF